MVHLAQIVQRIRMVARSWSKSLLDRQGSPVIVFRASQISALKTQISQTLQALGDVQAVWIDLLPDTESALEETLGCRAIFPAKVYGSEVLERDREGWAVRCQLLAQIHRTAKVFFSPLQILALKRLEAQVIQGDRQGCAAGIEPLFNCQCPLRKI